MSKLIRFKNFKRTDVRATCPNSGRTIVFKAGETRELGESWESMVLSAGIVPLDDIDRRETLAEDEAKALQAEAKAEAKAEVEAEVERAKALAEAQEKAQVSANKKKAASKKA